MRLEEALRRRGQVAVASEVREADVEAAVAARAGPAAEVVVAVAVAAVVVESVQTAARPKGVAVPRWARCTTSATW